MRALLLDTNILSELARPEPARAVIEFLRREPAVWISVITLHELIFGARCVSDPIKRQKLLEWIAHIEDHYAGSHLAITPEIARIAAEFRAAEQKHGRTLHIEDALIAATAANRSLTLVTRNTRDFQTLGIPLVNPWHTAA